MPLKIKLNTVQCSGRMWGYFCLFELDGGQDGQNTTIYSFWLPDNPNILPQHNCFYYCDLNTRFRVLVTEKVEPEPMLGLAYWCSPIEAGCTSYRKNINLSNIRSSFQEKIFERKKYFVCLLSSDSGVCRVSCSSVECLHTIIVFMTGKTNLKIILFTSTTVSPSLPSQPTCLSQFWRLKL